MSDQPKPQPATVTLPKDPAEAIGLDDTRFWINNFMFSAAGEYCFLVARETINVVMQDSAPEILARNRVSLVMPTVVSVQLRDLLVKQLPYDKFPSAELDAK